MRVKIEFEVEIADILHTDDELEAYLRFHFRDNGELALNNPFEDLGEPEPVFGTFNWNKEWFIINWNWTTKQTMNPEYNRKLESALIATGKLVAAKEGQPAPSVSELERLFDKLLQAIDNENMKDQAKASRELTASLIKWQVEKL
jgi:hypothetical protein